MVVFQNVKKEELESLGRIVNAYLDLAENRANRKIPMTMEDWASRLDKFLEFDDREILKDSGKITAKLARQHAESEFEKYRIVQDQLFQSDFDRLVEDTEKGNKLSVILLLYLLETKTFYDVLFEPN